MRCLVLLLLLTAGCQSPALTGARVYLAEGQTDRALAQVRRALEESPGDAEAYLLMGQVAAAQADYALMDSSLRVARSLDSSYAAPIAVLRHEHWALQHNTGVGLLQADPPRYAAALRAFANAVLADPDSVLAWHGLACAYARLDSVDRALEVYEHVLQSVPEDTTSLQAVGALYLRQERYAAAAAALERLVQAAPAAAAAHTNLGIALEHLHEFPEARRHYQQAVSLDPRSALAHYNLANACCYAREYEAAREEYETAMALAPGDRDTRYNLAVTCVRLADLSRAQLLLEALVKDQPQDRLAWHELGRLYARLGRGAESSAALQQAEALPDH